VSGRLQQGDRVTTPAGPGTITASYIGVSRHDQDGFHIVELDTGERRPFRNEQVEFQARQLALDDHMDYNPKGAP
jgi:hypothetical protein